MDDSPGASAVPHVLHNPAIGPLNDFKNFLYLVWIFLGLPSPTPVQYDLADYLQHGPKRSIIMAFRGVGKSYITAAYVVWLWLVNPQFKILVVSASEKKALEFATLVHQLINGMPMLSHLRSGKGQRDSVLSFDVGPATPSKDPSCNVSGIGGQITGGRADFIIPDDVEVKENSNTVALRQKLMDKVSVEFAAILKAEPWASVKYLGTPQTEQSIYFELLNRGYSIRVWPARYPKEPEKYVGRLAPMVYNALLVDPSLVMKPVDGKRFHEEELIGRELEAGAAGFQLQYMLDPTLSDAERYPLKLKDFLVFSVDKDIAPIKFVWSGDPSHQIQDTSLPIVGLNGDRWYRPFYASDQLLPYEHRILVVDPSGRGSDETAFCVLYYLKGYVFIVRWGGTLGGYDTVTLTQLAEIAKEYGVHQVVYEGNFGDGMYGNLLLPILNRVYPKCGLEEVHSRGNKFRRMCDTIEPPLSGHRLVIDEKVIRGDYKTPRQELQALMQLTRVTRETGSIPKDDRLDVLAIGLGFFAELMRKDTATNEEAQRDALAAEGYKRFMEAIGMSQVSTEEEGAWLNLGD